MPPEQINPPVQAVASVSTWRKGIWLFLALFVVLLGIVFATNKHIFKSKSEIVVGVGNNKLLRYFPNMNGLSVSADSMDPRYLFLEGYGGQFQLDIETNEITDLSSIFESRKGSIVHVGNRLFFASKGSVVQYDLLTKETKRFTIEDGLASGSNLYITPDLYDTDLLWISSFEGLSRISISTGTITTYRAGDLGIYALQNIEARIFHVGERYVWANVNANAYTNGGAARLDKQTGVWKSWSARVIEDLPAEKRFDSFKNSADGGRAIVENSDKLYLYTPDNDTWSVVVGDFTKPGSNVHLKDDSIYFWLDGIKVYDFKTGEVSALVAKEMFTDKPVSFEDFKVAYSRIVFDRQRNRLLVHPVDPNINSAIVIVPLDNPTKLQVIPFSIFEDTFGAFNTKLHDAKGDTVLLGRIPRGDYSNKSSYLSEFSISKNAFRNFDFPFAGKIKIVEDRIIGTNLVFCEMGPCRPETFVSTTTVSILQTGKLDFEVPLRSSVCHSYTGDVLDEIYLFGCKHTATSSVYKFDVGKKEYAEMGTLTLPIRILNDLLNSERSNQDFVEILSPDEAYTLTFKRVVGGNELPLSILDKEDALTQVLLPVAVEPPNHFNFAPEIRVSEFAFDPVESHIFWIGTDRGLIKLDLKSGKSVLYSEGSGLARNDILKIVPLAEVLVIEHSAGVYIYRRD